jgi:hypothetical protein
MPRTGNPKMVKGGPSMNPAGRPPGPTAPTLLLKDAFLLAAQRAGGDGPDGLVNYLQGVARTHPGVFVTALGRIIPIQVEAKGNGHIVIEVIQRFDDPKLIEHKANGHGNGHAVNGAKPIKDDAAE